jgi:AAA domain
MSWSDIKNEQASPETPASTLHATMVERWNAQERAKLTTDPIPFDRERGTTRLPWADTSRWDTEPCPDRQWAVRDRIPLRQVTLLSGEGSIGKSIIELMLFVAHVTGKEWLRSMPEPGGAFYIGCEDDEAELRIRFTGINKHYGTTFDELKALNAGAIIPQRSGRIFR